LFDGNLWFDLALVLLVIYLFNNVYAQITKEIFLPQPTQPLIPPIWSEQQKNIYYNPRSSSVECNSEDNSFICDPNKVLNINDVIKINRALKN